MILYFDFDQQKSASNKLKHGIDFDEAQALWTDPRRCRLSLKYPDEQREIVIGERNGKIWRAIITQRADVLRIISVRRARQKEIEIYEAPH